MEGDPVTFSLFTFSTTLRWQLVSRTVTSDRALYDNSSLSIRTRRYDIAYTEVDRDHHWEVINLLLVLPGLHLNTLETERMSQFGTRKKKKPLELATDCGP